MKLATIAFKERVRIFMLKAMEMKCS